MSDRKLGESIMKTIGPPGAPVNQAKGQWAASAPNDQRHVSAVAVGQSYWVRAYDEGLRRHGRHAAQLLLTHEDLDHRALSHTCGTEHWVADRVRKNNDVPAPEPSGCAPGPET